MVKLSDLVIGFIIVGATAITLLGIITDFTLEYGLTNAQLMNDSGGSCSASNTIKEIKSLTSMFGNQTMDSATYAPGQINAQTGDNMVTATQSSGLIVSLKTAVAPLTLSKAMITDLGCSLGVPPVMITAFEIALALSILLLIAGIFYFRPI